MVNPPAGSIPLTKVSNAQSNDLQMGVGGQSSSPLECLQEGWSHPDWKGGRERERERVVKVVKAEHFTAFGMGFIWPTSTPVVKSVPFVDRGKVLRFDRDTEF